MRAFLRCLAITAWCLFGGRAVQAAGPIPDEIVFSVMPFENSKDLEARFKPFAEYLAGELHTKVRLAIMTDYAGVIEGLRTGRIQLAYMSPSAYVRAYKVTGGGVTPLAVVAYRGRENGYRSVLYVRADSTYKTIDYLAGKTVAWVDVNSGSGYSVPRYYLAKQGFDPDKFFGRSLIAGSHENTIFSLLNGRADAAANWWQGEDSAYRHMVAKGMVPDNAVREIWRSPPIPEPPFVMAGGSAPEFVEAVQRALAAAPKKHPEMCLHIWESNVEAIVPASHSTYADLLRITEESDRLRRGR